MHTPQGLQWLDVDLAIGKGENVSVFGESGAGKTTLLRMLAGLTRPDEGQICVDGEIWFDSRRKINLPVQKRRVGFISQENSLFPNMTVRQNLEYAGTGSNVDEWLGLMGLKGLASQRPDKLSGGQKQRVALIRALVHEPRILLMDEPLSDLDVTARLGVQDEIVKAYRKTGLATILVSHDLSEVFKLSQKVFILEQGRVIKSGKPQDVFVNADVSGKFKFSGQIVEIHKDGVLNILTLAIGNQIAKVVASDEEITGLGVGSRVIVASKAFNPLILKV